MCKHFGCAVQQPQGPPFKATVVKMGFLALFRTLALYDHFIHPATTTTSAPSSLMRELQIFFFVYQQGTPFSAQGLIYG